MTVTVAGWDGSAPSPAVQAALAAATLVVGGERHLQALAADGLLPAAADRVLLGDLAQATARLLAHTGDAVVVASGDPGFFGVLRRLRSAGVRPVVHPALSSVALAFARLGLPWDDAVVVSAHGRDPRPALAAALAHPKVAVLTDAGADLATPLLAAGRRVVACERLGGPTERVVELVAPEPLAHPHVLLSLDATLSREPALSPDAPLSRGGRLSPAPGDRAAAAGPPWIAGPPSGPAGWALPEQAFAHRDSMVTKVEVRALALARLGPRIGSVVWDLGAGSGSVAVECARFGAYAVALDADADACARVQANATAHGVTVRVEHRRVTGPETVADLPVPDAVFVGGGGTAAVAAAVARRPARVVVALAALDRVRPVAEQLGSAGYVTDGSQLAGSRLARLPDGALRLEAQNPVTLVWGVA